MKKLNDEKEMLGRLVDVVEDFLTERGVSPTDLKKKEEGETKDLEEEAIICGSDYDELVRQFATALGLLETDKGNFKQYRIVAMQYEPEHWTPKVALEQMEELLDDSVNYVMITTATGNNSEALILMDENAFEDSEETLERFRKYIREILDDIELEHENCEYEFEGVKFYLGYAPL